MHTSVHMSEQLWEARGCTRWREGFTGCGVGGAHRGTHGVHTVGRRVSTAGRGTQAVGHEVETVGRGVHTAGRGMHSEGRAVHTAGRWGRKERGAHSGARDVYGGARGRRARAGTARPLAKFLAVARRRLPTLPRPPHPPACPGGRRRRWRGRGPGVAPLEGAAAGTGRDGAGGSRNRAGAASSPGLSPSPRRAWAVRYLPTEQLSSASSAGGCIPTAESARPSRSRAARTPCAPDPSPAPLLLPGAAPARPAPSGGRERERPSVRSQQPRM